MCTYLTKQIEVDGSGKGARGWFRVTDASVYVDHPVHAPYAHTLNIDFLNPAQGPSARVALELTEQSALALVAAIQSALAAAPPGLAAAPAAARPASTPVVGALGGANPAAAAPTGPTPVVAVSTAATLALTPGG